jgi:hypothetical protein
VVAVRLAVTTTSSRISSAIAPADTASAATSTGNAPFRPTRNTLIVRLLQPACHMAAHRPERASRRAEAPCRSDWSRAWMPAGGKRTFLARYRKGYRGGRLHRWIRSGPKSSPAAAHETHHHRRIGRSVRVSRPTERVTLATAGLLTCGSSDAPRLPGFPVASWGAPSRLQLREQPRICTVFPFSPRRRGPLLVRAITLADRGSQPCPWSGAMRFP